MFLKLDMNLGDVNSLYKCFGCFRGSMKFVFLYIDLRCSFLIFLNLFFTVSLFKTCFKTCLNNMHPSTKFTFENPEIIYENEKKLQVLDFLDVKTILCKDNSVETDVYFKSTNTYDYLPHDGTHLDHTKNNIPYNLAKRIIIWESYYRFRWIKTVFKRM